MTPCGARACVHGWRSPSGHPGGTLRATRNRWRVEQGGGNRPFPGKGTRMRERGSPGLDLAERAIEACLQDRAVEVLLAPARDAPDHRTGARMLAVLEQAAAVGLRDHDEVARHGASLRIGEGRRE